VSLLEQVRGFGTAGNVMSSIAGAVVAALLLGLSYFASAASVWFSADDSLYRVDAGSNQALLVSSPGRVQALAINHQDGGAWILVGSRLLKLNENGVPQADVDLKSLGIQNPGGLTLNPYDESLWLADGRTILRLGAAGQALSTWKAPGVVRTLALGLDENIWVLGNKRLWRYSPQGTFLTAQDLTGLVKEEPKLLAVDSLGDALWLAGQKQLVLLKLSNPGQIMFTLAASQIVSGLALDQKRGTLWVLSKDGLTGIARDGSLFTNINLGALGLTGASALAYDSVTEALWVAHSSGLARFSSNGELAATIATNRAITALGVAPFLLTPSVSLMQPPQNALTNNPRPEFRLGYDALCSGTSCGFTPSFFSSYSLSALLNNQPVGSLFVFDGNTGQASFTPASRLPEGSNTFSAQVQDRFGHLSDPVTNIFTVDTIAPKFLTITPAEGSTFATPNVLIQGTIDDPTARVVLSGMGASQTGTNFNFPVVLQPGLNTFVLSAIDPAGNVATTTLHLSLASVSVSITSPASGSIINSDSVTASGTFQGPGNTGITVNGIVAAITGNTFVAPNVPLQPGANTLTAIATAPNNQTATQSVSVTSSGSAPIQFVASPAQGVTPLAVTFTINNRTGNAIQSARADFTGSGFFIDVSPNVPITRSYATAGTFNARFIITDSTGATYNQTVTIVAQDPAQIDQILRTAWNGFTTALAAGDTVQALQYFNNQAQQKYQPVFQALASSLPQIVGSFSQPQLMNITNEIGEYAINRTIDGVNRLFLIYFLRDVDGVWRVDSM